MDNSNKGVWYKEYRQGRRFLTKIRPGESVVQSIKQIAVQEEIHNAVVLSASGSVKNVHLNDIKSGAKVALPNDPSNLARALLVLQQAGLVKVKEGVNPARISELDLAANPHKLKFVALEAAQLPRVLEDADYVVVNGNFAVSSGLKLSEAVVLEKTPDLYLNVVAVKTGNENSQWAKDLAAAYRSAEFKAVVDSQFAGYAKPAFLQ